MYDGLGSVVGEVAPDGSLTCTRKLDVYGCVRSSSGTATSKHMFVGSLGHPSDDETGLIYMRARHYDPVTGRFVSEDPGRSGSNWFAYCANDPVNGVDANGKEAIAAIVGAIVGLIVGAISAYYAHQNVWLGMLTGALAGAVGGLVGNPAAAGFVGSFLGSVFADFCAGGFGRVNWGKAVALGVAGAAFGGIVGWFMGSITASCSTMAVKFAGAEVAYDDEVGEAVVGSLIGATSDSAMGFAYGD